MVKAVKLVGDLMPSKRAKVMRALSDYEKKVRPESKHKKGHQQTTQQLQDLVDMVCARSLRWAK